MPPGQKELAEHLSYKSALVLLPSKAVRPPIEAVRRRYDRHVQRWPPHINLIYPFLLHPSEPAGVSAPDETELHESDLLKAQIRQRVCRAVKNISPFSVRLDCKSPGVFHHSKRSKTVYLAPSSCSIQPLQQALQSEFTECDADKRKYTPHLTIGQASGDTQIEAIKGSMSQAVTDETLEGQGQEARLDWHVDKVFVIERSGFHGRFKIVGAVKLGSDGTVARDCKQDEHG